jgi:hypothetical protein
MASSTRGCNWVAWQRREQTEWPASRGMETTEEDRGDGKLTWPGGRSTGSSASHPWSRVALTSPGAAVVFWRRGVRSSGRLGCSAGGGNKEVEVWCGGKQARERPALGLSSAGIRQQGHGRGGLGARGCTHRQEHQEAEAGEHRSSTAGARGGSTAGARAGSAAGARGAALESVGGLGTTWSWGTLSRAY